MEYCIELIDMYGVQFAHTMIQKILQEANAMNTSGRDYKLSDHLREGMIHRASLWKEALILHDYMHELVTQSVVRSALNEKHEERIRTPSPALLSKVKE